MLGGDAPLSLDLSGGAGAEVIEAKLKADGGGGGSGCVPRGVQGLTG
jgi:hypothetical protein